jgi:4-amino-4-deoxy-L-arabinose transferase-like glycosyltransferase
VFVIGVRLASPTAALLAVALHLFLPYGIIASQNFQPDPLMTVASLWAIFALIRHYDDQSRGRFVVAAALVGLAGLIKPMSVFLTLPVIGLLALLHQEPIRQRLTAAVEMAIVGMLGPLIFYGNSALRGSLVQDQMRMRFEPQLMGSMFFWGGLSRMISRVETWPLFILAVIGAIVARDKVARAVLAALFIGYFAFAVAFTYHMPTHDYYHLPYLPVIAIGVGVLLARLESFVPGAVRLAAVAVLSLVTFAAGTANAWPRMEFADAAGYAQMYREIGELTGHDRHVLFLDPEYGFSMMYHAEVSGDSWPNVDDLAAEKIDERPPIDADARFVRDYSWADPTYFIVTDLGSLDAEKDLQAMLAKRATLVRSTDRYRVYKFTK